MHPGQTPAKNDQPRRAPRTDQSEQRATDARWSALSILTQHAERMPDLLPIDPDTRGLDPRDAALTHAILDASVRRWRTLAYIVEQAGGRPLDTLEPSMRAALIGGSAQLWLLDRVPDHAAIDQTVEWAKRSIRAKAGGMVNAILRRVARARGARCEVWDAGADQIPLSDGGAIELIGISLPDEPNNRLGVACSLPAKLIRSWCRLDDNPTEMAWHTLVRPPTLCRLAPGTGLSGDARFEPHDDPSHAVYIGGRESIGDALAAYPGLSVQDPAASHVIDALEDEGEETIVDLCAGRGTKTRQLLERFPSARVIACEIEEHRLASLQAAFGGNPRVEIAHADSIHQRGGAWADLVLTDVPCSNSGVLARRSEARYRVRSKAMGRLVETQREILRNASHLVGHAGRLIYATCSLEPEENEEQARWAHKQLGLTIERERRIFPSGLPGERASAYRDGSYAAELRRLEGVG